MAHTLTRIRHKDGKVYAVEVRNISDAQQHIAWCMTDNIGMARGDAARIASRFQGEEMKVPGYTFTYA